MCSPPPSVISAVSSNIKFMCASLHCQCTLRPCSLCPVKSCLTEARLKDNNLSQIDKTPMADGVPRPQLEKDNRATWTCTHTSLHEMKLLLSSRKLCGLQSRHYMGTMALLLVHNRQWLFCHSVKVQSGVEKHIHILYISKSANITKIVSYKLTSCIENFTEVKVCIISKM